MQRKSAGALAGAIFIASAAVSAPRLSAATLTLDNFEEYSGTNNQQIASASSTSTTYTWQETGNPLSNPLTATNGSTSATQSYLLDGLASAYVKVNFASATQETLRYLLPAGEKNLSAYDTETIEAKSNLASTATQLALFITDGTTTYMSTAEDPLSTTTTTYTFDLDPADVIATTTNPESFATVLGNATSIGVDLINTTGASTSEAVAIDDLEVHSTPVPEPMMGGLMLMATSGLIVRRRGR